MFCTANWLHLCKEAGIISPHLMTVWKEIERRYSEPHRHYHTMSHISYMLENLEPLMQFQNGELVIPIKLAILFHDIVYQPGAEDNENQSADLADRLLIKLGTAPWLWPKVRRQILATTHLREPHNLGEELIIDLDLLSLSKPYDEFMADGELIRQEYAHVPDEEFRHGRRAILQRFLNRRPIYYTHWFALREPAAINNLTRAIQELD